MLQDPRNQEMWKREKAELLKSHPGQIAAYQKGKRVALEPSLKKLFTSLNKKLGTPREPCELYVITEYPTRRRGPSPRTKRPIPIH